MKSCPRRGGAKLPLVITLAVLVLALLAGVIGLRSSAPACAWSISLRQPITQPPGAGDGLLVLCTADQRVRAFDLDSGAALWERDDLQAFGTPLVADGRVYVASFEDVVFALDARTGEDVWSGDSDGYEFARSGEALIVGRYHGFDVLEAATGAFLWEYRASADAGDEVQVTESVATADGVAYVGYGLEQDFTLSFGGHAMVKGGVYAVDLDGGRRLWTSAVEDRVLHPPLIDDGSVYVKTTSGLINSVYALDQADGEVRWKHTGAQGAPQLASGALCFVGVDGRTTKVGPMPMLEQNFAYLGLDPATGDERWSRRAGPDQRGTLVHGDRVLYVREGSIEARAGASGRRRWSLSTEGETSARPTVAAGRLIVCTEDGRICVYPLD